MRLKRLRKAGDVTLDSPSESPTGVSATAADVSSRGQGAERSSHVTDPATASHKLPQQKPLSAAQQQKMYDRGFRKFPSVIQTMDEAASAQPEALQSVDFHHEATAIQADSGAPSEDEEDFEEREDDRANDPACIQCDDGGDIMFCDGSCMRAFHCGVERLSNDKSDSDKEGDAPAASHSPTKMQQFHCNPLGMPLDLYQHLKDTKDTFHCPNCLAGVHQCFKCKQEGVVEAHAADPHNARFANQLVFRCGVASCGRFYHAACLNMTEEDMQAAFLCPLHTCRSCGGDESDTGKGELIPCRRCPKAFHEHCMPRSLLDLPGKNRKQRIWVAQFKNGECISEVERSLIYCAAHKIPDDCNNPKHKRPVFVKALLLRGKIHFANLFPNLMSSQKVLAQVEVTENVPLRDRLKQMSGRAPGATSHTPARSGTSSPASSDPAPHQPGSSKQPSVGLDTVAVAANGQPHSNTSQAAPSAGTQATKRAGPARHTPIKHTGNAAAVSSAPQTSVSLAEMSITELKAMARDLKAQKHAGFASSGSAVPNSTRAAKQARLAPQATASDTAVLSNMGPPPARKRPPLPDRPLLPPKKRRAVEEALPSKQSWPSAAAQLVPGDMQAPKSAHATSSKQVHHLEEACMQPPPQRRLVRAGSSSSTDSQPKSGSKQAYARAVPASASLAQAVMPAPDTAAAQRPGPQCQPQLQSQSDDRPGPMQHDLHTQLVGHYQEQHDEGDVDILADIGAVPLPVEANEPGEHGLGGPAAAGGAAAEAAAAEEAAPDAVNPKAPKPGAVEAEPILDVAEAPAGLQLTTEYARRLQAMTPREHKAEAQQRMEQILQACTKAGRVMTLAKVIQNTRQPEPYRQPSKMTVTEERLRMIEKAVAAAEKDPARAGRWVDASIAKEMLMHEDNLSMVLAPFLHGKRYSSYGRHFTKLVLLKQVAQMLSFYLHDGDTVVDFSCGANAFVPLVKQEGAKQGLSISGCSFDIITSQNLDGFQRRSWMEVRPGDLPVGDKLVIGLNPPFGKNNMLARKFVKHAAVFWPRVIVLIVPPGVPIPPGYRVVYEEQETMKDRAFFVPGSKNESWNQVPPALRVLLRRDWVNSNPPDGTGWYHTAVAPMYGARCRPRPAPVQPLIPHHPLPQQHMLWQQAPPRYPVLQQQQHGFPHHMQHAQQPQQAQYVQQHHAQQQHMVAQQAQQQGFGVQAASLPPPPPGQSQHTHVLPSQQLAQPPSVPAQHLTGRPAWFSILMPNSLPGPYK